MLETRTENKVHMGKDESKVGMGKDALALIKEAIHEKAQDMRKGLKEEETDQKAQQHFRKARQHPTSTSSSAAAAAAATTKEMKVKTPAASASKLMTAAEARVKQLQKELKAAQADTAANPHASTQDKNQVKEQDKLEAGQKHAAHETQKHDATHQVHNAAVPAAQAAVPSLLQQAIAEMKKDQEKGLKEKSKDEDAWHKYHAQSKKELAAENIKEAQEKANETKEAKVKAKHAALEQQRKAAIQKDAQLLKQKAEHAKIAKERKALAWDEKHHAASAFKTNSADLQSNARKTQLASVKTRAMTVTTPTTDADALTTKAAETKVPQRTTSGDPNDIESKASKTQLSVYAEVKDQKAKTMELGAMKARTMQLVQAPAKAHESTQELTFTQKYQTAKHRALEHVEEDKLKDQLHLETALRLKTENQLQALETRLRDHPSTPPSIDSPKRTAIAAVKQEANAVAKSLDTNLASGQASLLAWAKKLGEEVDLKHAQSLLNKVAATTSNKSLVTNKESVLGWAKKLGEEADRKHAKSLLDKDAAKSSRDKERLQLKKDLGITTSEVKQMNYKSTSSALSRAAEAEVLKDKALEKKQISTEVTLLAKAHAAISASLAASTSSTTSSSPAKSISLYQLVNGGEDASMSSRL